MYAERGARKEIGHFTTVAPTGAGIAMDIHGSGRSKPLRLEVKESYK